MHAQGCTAAARMELKFVIVYDDFEAGLRAKSFADQLLDAQNCTRRCIDSVWRAEMFEFPRLALEATKDVADSDFIIISLRGDANVPHPFRNWLEEQLAAKTEDGAALIALFDPVRSKRSTVEAAREYFRCVSIEHGVPFFSHAVVTPAAPARTEPANTKADSKRRRLDRALSATTEPVAA